MKSTEVILAGFIGSATVFGLIALSRFLKSKEYKREYSDHHKLFGSRPKKHYFGYGEGIEINSFL